VPTRIGYFAALAALKVASFGQNGGGTSKEAGARVSQSAHTVALSQRWHAATARAS
jgi:hypothetical protein